MAKRKRAGASERPGPYAFEIRFGGPVVELGVVPIPRVVLDHYAYLGVSDAQMTFITHILAYKWTADNPFPKRDRLNLSAHWKTQQTWASGLRKLGLLFTSRRKRKGRVVSLIYDLDSLLHNCVCLYHDIQAATNFVMEDSYPDLEPEDDDYARTFDEVRAHLTPTVVEGYTIHLPPQVLERLKAGEYDDVPEPWSSLELAGEEKAADSLETAADSPPEAPQEPTGEAALEVYFGPRPVRHPVDLGKQSDSPKTIAVQAGGADDAALAVADLICRWNGIAAGAEILSKKERRHWLTRIRETIERWGGATLPQARLAQQAWEVLVGFPYPCNPFYGSWPASYGTILARVKEGGITAEDLRELLQDKAKLEQEKRTWADIAAEQQDQPRPASPGPELPLFWRSALADLRGQMTQATFDLCLANATATHEDHQVTILSPTKEASERLSSRLRGVLERTLRRLLEDPDLAIVFAEQEP